MRHVLTLAGQDHEVALSRASKGYRLHLADRSVATDLQLGADGRSKLLIDGREHDVLIATRGDEVFVHLDGEAYALRYEHPLTRLAHAAAGAAESQLRAPMPGSVVSLAAAVGDPVAKGRTLLVIESMKMETTLVAPRDGVVAAIHVAVAQTFERDAVLLELQP